jgi:hypothetical protein
MLQSMWQLLGAYTYSVGTNDQRIVNHQNEWGGFSPRVGLVVFTGWKDQATRVKRKKAMVVSDLAWPSKHGLRNQERWVDYAIANGGRAAYFLVKAVDVDASRRVVESLDSTQLFVGDIVRIGGKSVVIPDTQMPV